jgi:hypothetical protein
MIENNTYWWTQGLYCLAEGQFVGIQPNIYSFDSLLVKENPSIICTVPA